MMYHRKFDEETNQQKILLNRANIACLKHMYKSTSTVYVVRT